MNDATQYWVVQHVADLLRDEPRNVGIIVKMNNEISARFYGEDNYGNIDPGQLTAFPYPQVYVQWISYWRRGIEKRQIDAITSPGRHNYRVKPGGEITGIGSDTLLDVVNNLYSSLVSIEAKEMRVAALSEKTKTTNLKKSVISELEKARILERTQKGSLLGVNHPVRCDIELKGTSMNHKPALVQQNSSLFVIEIVDFASSRKSAAKDHAGWMAHMFMDLKGKHGPSLHPISIVKKTPEDMHNPLVQYGLDMLSGSELIEWNNDLERASFIRERIKVAQSEGDHEI